MRGQPMPTGAVDEGTGDASVRGQPLPPLKTQDQDAVRAMASLSLHLALAVGVRGEPWSAAARRRQRGARGRGGRGRLRGCKASELLRRTHAYGDS